MPRECPAPQTWTNASGKLLEYQIWITECYLNIYTYIYIWISSHGQSPIHWSTCCSWNAIYIYPHIMSKWKCHCSSCNFRPEVALFECYAGYTQIPFGRTLVAAMHTGQCKWNWGNWSSPLLPALAILTRSVSFIRPCLQLFVNLVKMQRDGQETHHL
jgi:hypothetical protein